MVQRKWRPRTRPQDVRVGRHFMLSDFLYSETATTRGIANCPTSWRSAEVRGIQGLCQHILDPVVDKFGPVSVTFGFCSLALWRYWYPSKTNPVALHLFRPPQGGIGGAADILIHSSPQDPREAFNWIRANCEFDRLIIYPGSAIICVAWTEIEPRYHAKEWVLSDSGPAQYLNAGWDKPAEIVIKANSQPEFEQQTLFFLPHQLKDCSSLLLSPLASLISFLNQ